MQGYPKRAVVEHPLILSTTGTRSSCTAGHLWDDGEEERKGDAGDEDGGRGDVAAPASSDGPVCHCLQHPHEGRQDEARPGAEAQSEHLGTDTMRVLPLGSLPDHIAGMLPQFTRCIPYLWMLLGSGSRHSIQTNTVMCSKAFALHSGPSPATHNVSSNKTCCRRLGPSSGPLRHKLHVIRCGALADGHIMQPSHKALLCWMGTPLAEWHVGFHTPFSAQQQRR